MFGVREAIEVIGERLGGIEILLEPTICIADIPGAIPKDKQQTTLVCKFGEKTVACIFTREHILLLDSHSYGETGAFVALASRADASKLLYWYKDLNSLINDRVRCTLVSFLATGHVAAANLYPLPNQFYRLSSVV